MAAESESESTPSIDETAFASLRLSPEKFANYQKQDTSKLWKSMARREGAPTIKIVGYGAAAVAAIKAANDNGEDFVTVPWSGFDSVVRSTVFILLGVSVLISIPI